MVDIAFELAQELQISHYNNSRRLCHISTKGLECRLRHHRGSAACRALRGAEKYDRGNPLHSQQHIFADWHTIIDGVKMVDIAFELAQELQISHFNDSHRLCQSPQKQQRHPKRCLCVLSCRDSNPERQNQNLLCYHYTTAQTSARKRWQR